MEVSISFTFGRQFFHRDVLLGFCLVIESEDCTTLRSRHTFFRRSEISKFHQLREDGLEVLFVRNRS